MSENPNEIHKKGGKEDVPGLKSGQGQVDATAVVEAEAKVDGRSGPRGFGVARKKTEMKWQGGKRKRDPLPYL